MFFNFSLIWKTEYEVAAGMQGKCYAARTINLPRFGAPRLQREGTQAETDVRQVEADVRRRPKRELVAEAKNYFEYRHGLVSLEAGTLCACHCVQEYTRFIKQGEEDLREKQRQFYLQISFVDPYVRITEDGLHDLLCATDDDELRRDMHQVFGTKDQSNVIAYSLFIQRTWYSKTTMSMQTAADSRLFRVIVPDERVYGDLIQKDPKDMAKQRRPPPQPPHQGKVFRVASGSTTTNGFVVRFDAFETSICGIREKTPLVKQGPPTGEIRD
ncbi:hypothetical protein BGZ65_004017, partial [Modicella reniformis]